MSPPKSPLTLRRATHFPDARARVAISRMVHQPPISQHLHEFSEIALILSGSGVHVTEGFRHELQAGDVLVISRRRAHGYEETSDLNLVNILFRDDVLPRIRRELGNLPGYHALFGADGAARRKAVGYISRVRLTAPELAQLEDWAGRLEAETLQAQQGGYLLSEAYLTLIIGVLCRRHGHATFGRRGAAHPLGSVLSWLEKSLAEPLRVEDMAARAGMSARGFHRAFRALMGTSPIDYLLHLRLQRAAERLRAPREPGRPAPRIGEIAQACGFGDSNYFSRAFRQHHGQSPRQWRRGATG